MRYKIIPSKRFEKEMKRCQKRGYNLQLIKDLLRCLPRQAHYPKNTNLISSTVTAKVSGNVTFSLTGCSFGRYTIRNLSLCY